MELGFSGAVRSWNPGAERMFGWKREEILGLTPCQWLEEEVFEVFAREVLRGKGAPWESRVEFHKKAGARGVADVRAVPMKADGGLAGWLVIWRDQTALHEAQQQLLDERALLKTLIDAVPDPIFCKDRDGRFLLHNKADHLILGKTAEDCIGKTVFDFPSLNRHAERFFAEDMQVVRTGQPVVDREGTFVRVDGGKGWFVSSKFPLRNAAGQVVGLVGIARDITQRKQAERQLADEECLLRALVDAIPDPMFLKDREGRHLAINGANADLFGIPQGQSLGKTALEWPIPPEFAAQYMADDQRVMETGVPLVNREEPYETADGRRGWLLTSKYPLRNASGQISGLVGVSRDVTALKVATEELQRTRSRMVDHVENSPLAVIEWGPDFRVIAWTGQAHHLFGWKAEEVVGKEFLDLHIVHPDDMPRVALFTRRLTESRERSNVCQSRNLTRSGEVIHCAWYNSALYDPEGRILSILSLVMDVSDQVKADRTILEKERLYHALVESTNTGYVLADEFGRVLDANDEFVQLTGHQSLGEILHRSLMQWVEPNEVSKCRRAFKKLLRDGALVNFEADWVGAYGAVIPVEANARVRDTSAGLRIVAFCRNISARRKAEVERQAFERKLLETQKLESLGVLAGGIAHDFNNLLTGVLGNASLAQIDAGTESPLQPYLEQIEEAALRAADLCRQMLAYSGKGSFVVGRMDLNGLVEETSKLLQISVSKKAVVEYDLAPGLPPVLVDPTQMRQVIMNLVINASEAVGERGGRIWVRSRRVRLHPNALADTAFGSELPPGDYLCLEVRDNGSGMAPEVKARIFDPFFTTKFTGRGLGLAAVQGIVRGHRGALKVESQLGKGTCFRVFLPCAEGVADPKRLAPVSNPNWRGSGRVLVVDDEPAVRVTTSHMLESLGFRVLAAADGQAGVAEFLAAPDPFELVMLDLTMPSGDGDEVLKEIRRVSPRIPVLLMSGFDESEVLSRFQSKDIAGFIHKPFAFPVLREKLQEILAAPRGL